MLLLVGAGCSSTAPIAEDESDVVNATIEASIVGGELHVNDMVVEEVDDDSEVQIESEEDNAALGSEPIDLSENAPAIVSVNMTAKQFSFEPSAITVQKGDTVRLIVTSADVAHGISIPAFGISKDLDVGVTETIEFVADKAGTFPFFCNVFCGSDHKSMTGSIIVNE